MKKYIFLIFSLFFSLSFIQAQNIVLSHEGENLTNNQSVNFIGNANLFDMAIELVVTNNSFSTMDITCYRYEIDTITNSALYMCWANCTVLPSGGTVTLDPGQSSDLFSAHCNPNGGFGVERSLYTFFDANNPNDSISFMAVFSTTSFLLENNQGDAMIMESAELWGIPNQELEYQIPAIHNISTSNINLQVQQEILHLTEGSEVSFEWNGILYDDNNISEPLQLAEDEINSSFFSYYASGSNIGVSEIKYHIFETENPANSQTLLIIYNTTAVGVLQSEQLIKHEAFPNPSHGNINISYDLKDGLDNGRIEIYDLHSHLVKRENISKQRGSIFVNLPNGLYFYQITTSKIKSEAIKFIII